MNNLKKELLKLSRISGKFIELEFSILTRKIECNYTKLGKLVYTSSSFHTTQRLFNKISLPSIIHLEKKQILCVFGKHSTHFKSVSILCHMDKCVLIIHSIQHLFLVFPLHHLTSSLCYPRPCLFARTSINSHVSFLCIVSIS